MKRNDLIESFLKFFQNKNHNIISGKSLIPENDPTVLFTTAGMHPLVPYLLSQDHPKGSRLANVQNCIRTGDIDEVGDDSHLTFFQMLGNWSIGDYYKKESINYSLEFLVDILKLDKKRIAVSTFGGEGGIEKDETSLNIWKDLGINNIVLLGMKDNFWGPAGLTGPCGPDTEIFYYTSQMPQGNPKTDKNWVEIWNNVFLEYQKDSDGNFLPNQRKCVDTGMGLERMLAILNQKNNVYETEIFRGIIEKICFITKKDYQSNKKNIRIIADHIRSSCFIIGDEKKIIPSNMGAGYVLRKLIRRSIRILRNLFDKDYVPKSLINIASSVFEIYEEFDLSMQDFIKDELLKEEQRFLQTLEKGEQEFLKMLNIFKKENIVSGQNAFKLYDTYGFPLEITQDLASEYDLKVDKDGFFANFEKHKELSKSEHAFKGGLQDNSEDTTKLHTATHLLHKALKMVLGEEVGQKGSNITKERLRFDFNFERKMTKEELEQVEEIVNKQIKRALEIDCKEMPLEQARQIGAIAYFDQKYDDIIKVYSIGDFSTEVCGGPHVKNTSELGEFVIQKEQSSAQGIRRIKAILK